MLFIALMLISNLMGSPEYAVESSPAQEVSQELIPQEGHSVILAVPYDKLAPGTYTPFDAEEYRDNPELAEALEEFEDAMNRHSCNLSGSAWKDNCKKREDAGEIRYENSFTKDAMPDATAVLIVEPEQHNMKKVTIHYEVVDPDDPGNMLVDSFDDRVAFRHADSGYEE
jgi:hypothetical protein